MKRKTLLTFLFAILVILGAASLLVWNGMTDHLGKADIALVLGNKVNPDGSPSPRLKARLDTAISLFQKGYFQRIFPPISSVLIFPTNSSSVTASILPGGIGI